MLLDELIALLPCVLVEVPLQGLGALLLELLVLAL